MVSVACDGQKGLKWVKLGRKTRRWRAPSERIRTASEIPIEVDLTDEDALPIYIKISKKALHLRRLGMKYDIICERLGVNRWMAMRAVRWAKDVTRKKP